MKTLPARHPSTPKWSRSEDTFSSSSWRSIPRAEVAAAALALFDLGYFAKVLKVSVDTQGRFESAQGLDGYAL